MASFKMFEEMEVWKKARELTRQIYRISANGSFSRDFGLRDQIRRASVSIMSNIAEGFERGGRAEFIQFLSVAKASAAEIRAHLYVGLDQNYIEQKDFDSILALTKEVSRMANGLIDYLRRSKIRGAKYKADFV